jgi:hypothetical protein
MIALGLIEPPKSSLKGTPPEAARTAEQPVQQRRGPSELQVTESLHPPPVRCSALILIMASEGRVGACPKGKRSRSYPCLSVGFSGRTHLPTTMRDQAPTWTSGVRHALLQPTAPILLRRGSPRQNHVPVHPRIAHVQNTNSQYNYAPFGKKLSYAANREELQIAERFADPSVRRMIEIDLALVDHYDALLGDVELYLTRTAKVDDVNAFHRLRSVPGVGKILALVLLYEIHDVGRFAEVGNFLSYARLVRCAHESGGKKLGGGGKKIGNPHLRWAFAEAACLFVRQSETAKKWLKRQEKKRGKGKALGILAAKLGRAVYHVLRKKVAFEEKRFWAS